MSLRVTCDHQGLVVSIEPAPDPYIPWSIATWGSWRPASQLPTSGGPTRRGVSGPRTLGSTQPPKSGTRIAAPVADRARAGGAWRREAGVDRGPYRRPTASQPLGTCSACGVAVRLDRLARHAGRCPALAPNQRTSDNDDPGAKGTGAVRQQAEARAIYFEVNGRDSPGDHWAASGFSREANGRFASGPQFDSYSEDSWA